MASSLTVDLVRRFVKEEVEPLVREMDENESMDPKVIKGLFEQGVGIHSIARDLRPCHRGIHYDAVLTLSPFS
jgi:hypothetical protein